MAQVRWRNRRRDTRHKDAASLYQAAKKRRARCAEAKVRSGDLEVVAEDSTSDPKGQIRVRTPLGELTPTFWSFGQLCSRSGWRAVDLRRIHAELIKLNVEYGLAYLRSVQQLKVLADEQYQLLRAMTGPDFGRVWDCDLLELLQPVLGAPEWQPLARPTKGERAAIGYFSSDQDMYIFLASRRAGIEISTPHGSERLKRGLMITNSEVGASSLILATFLFRSVCSNRLIMGLRQMRRLKLRHSKGLPKTYEQRVRDFLAEMGDGSQGAAAIRKVLERSMVRPVAEDDEGVKTWLARRGFTVKKIEAIIAKARQTEGSARTVWDLVQGATGVAAEEKNADQRFALEARASRLLQAA